MKLDSTHSCISTWHSSSRSSGLTVLRHSKDHSKVSTSRTETTAYSKDGPLINRVRSQLLAQYLSPGVLQC